MSKQCHSCNLKNRNGTEVVTNYKQYHGCNFKNRNGTYKEVKYNRGESCLLATNERCWRPTKSKYLKQKIYHTRQRKKAVSKQLKLAILIQDQLDSMNNSFIKSILSLVIYKSKEELGFKD